MKKVYEFIWQFPQMIIAYIWYLIQACTIIGVTKNTGYPQYILYRYKHKGGVTLGNKIFLSDTYHGEYLSLILAHERGHVIQSRYWGPLYLIVIGFPSLLWAATHKWLAPKKSYYWFYTESNANKLGGVGVNKNGVLTWKHLIGK